MAKNKHTPEEQLLNLIEKEKGFKMLRPKRKKFRLLSFINLRNLWLFFPSLKGFLRNKLARLKSSIKEPNLKVINKVLVGVSIILIVYLITDFTFIRPDIKQFYKGASVTRERRLKESTVEEVRPFLYYLEMVRRRNIFLPVALKTVESSQVEAKNILATLIGELRLVGISWGEEPQAMIEEKNTKKTYFLKTGDTVNKLKIETIYKDRVILTYDGQKTELM